MPPVYLQSGDPETESTASLHAPGLLGSRFTYIGTQRQGPGVGNSPAGRSKRYPLIKTDSTMSVAPYPGAVAWWADKARYLVTTSLTATHRNNVAGVFRRAWNAAGDYMCVQIGGPGMTKVIDGDAILCVAGDALIPSTVDGRASRLAVGVALTHTPLGRVVSPITTDAPAGLVLTDLDVPETT